MNADDVIKKATEFAGGRVEAVSLNGSPEDCFKVGWFPRVAGKRVTCGDKYQTPEGGFHTEKEAIECAIAYRQICRDWLAENSPQETESN